MIDLLRAAPHVALHRGRTFVVKVGGACLLKPAGRAALARSLATIHALGSRLVVVHGGGPQTDELSTRLGETPRFVGGRRITSATGLRALAMATAGKLHGELLAALAAEVAAAVGVARASASLIVARPRPPVTVDGEVIDFGRVGDVVSVDPAPLVALLDAGRIPVVSPPVGDGSGALLNVNADVLAAELAIALSAAKLLSVTDAPGVLADRSDPDSLLSVCTLTQLERLGADGALEGGMRVKAETLAHALRGGVARVHVVSGVDPAALVTELYTNQGAGTLVTIEAEAEAEALALSS
ncbi:MAG: acetylglutamate kinase [Planctomycetota bacterium]